MKKSICFSLIALSFLFIMLLSFFSGEAFAAVYTILDDRFGGDCNLIGTWTDSTNTCTLSTNIISIEKNPSAIILGADDITLNGNQHTLSGNDVIGSRGIIILSRSGVTITDITVNNFNYGVVVNSSNHCTVSHVTATDNVIGIKLEDSALSTISNSTTIQNASGISILSSENSTLSGNTASQNKIGINLQNSQSITFTNNSIENNIDDGSSDSGTGLLIDNSTYNVFELNNFSKNDTHGAWLHNGSNLNSFIGNTFANNAIGLNLRDTANSNTVSGNEFILNSIFQAYDAGTSNVFSSGAEGGNHWDNYDTSDEGCVDSDYDAICDASYVISPSLSEDSKAVALTNYAYTITAEGGDCSQIGTWNESTLTCALTGDVNVIDQGILVVGDNIILDGNGWPIRGTHTAGSIGVGVYGSQGVTLRNLDVAQFQAGIMLKTANSCLLDTSTITDNKNGVHVISSINNLFSNSTLSDNSFAGMYLNFGADSNTVSGNTFLNNDRAGLGIDGSNNTVYGNHFVGNLTFPAMALGSGNVFHTPSNGGNHWDTFDAPDEGCEDNDYDGYCDDPYIFDLMGIMTIEDSMAIFPRTYSYRITSDGGDCAQIGQWDDATLTCTLTSDIIAAESGIVIASDNVILDGNERTISGAGVAGSVGVLASKAANIVVKNIAVSQFDAGIAFSSANSCLLDTSTITDNKNGVHVISSINNLFSNSTLSDNSFAGMYLNFGADSNTVSGNTFLNNDHAGLGIDGSNNTVYGNHFAGSLTIPAMDLGSGNVFHTPSNGGNHWDTFDAPDEGCEDNDYDGYCDDPYIFDLAGIMTLEDSMAIFPRTYSYRITSDGGDCAQIGQWDDATLTCTLTSDIIAAESGIVIASDNVILDGNERTISGAGVAGSVGVLASKAANIVVKNIAVSQFDAGIAFSSANSCLLDTSTITDNKNGVHVISSINNLFSNSTLSDNSFSGMYLNFGADSNTVSGNTFLNNDHAGLGIDGSNNTVYGNHFAGSLTIPAMDLGSGNVYFTLTDGGNRWDEFDSPDEGCEDKGYDGYCDDTYTYNFAGIMTIEDPMAIFPRTYSYTITSDGGDCAQIGQWDDATLTCTLTSDIIAAESGIVLTSDNVILDGNERTISGAGVAGSVGVLASKTANVVVKNIAVSQFDAGIAFSSANSCLLDTSTITDNKNGVHVISSINNLFSNSTLSDNSFAGMYLNFGADSNTVSGNTFLNNDHAGLGIDGSNNTVYGNHFAGSLTIPAMDLGSGNVYFTLIDGGNRWDEFDSPEEGCFDSDHNGFCDNSYVLEILQGLSSIEDPMSISPLLGNADGVNGVDIRDAISILQLLTGKDPGFVLTDFYLPGGDNKWGLEENLYILQQVSTP